jgi:hypothetical protein
MFSEHELDEDSKPNVDKLSAWVTELDLLTAQYEGYSYSLRNRASLELALDSIETDLVSVGRLVGTYSRNFGELRSDQASRYQRILEWIVENAPESDVAGEPSGGIFGNRLCELWQKQIKRHPLNSKIAYNAACSLSHCANDVAIGITQRVLEYDPGDISATELMRSLIDRKMHRCFSTDDPVFAEFDADEIVFESNDLSPMAASDVIELVLYPFNLNIPISTLWSNEQTLKFNPNDAILRAEVMAMYGSMVQSYRLPANAATVRKKLAHIAWLYKNAPSSRLKWDALRFWLDADFSVYKKVFDKKHKSQKITR